MRWLSSLFLGALLIYAAPSIWQLLVYLQTPFDLAIYDQALWLIAHGESFITVAGKHVNTAHFSPILYAISPLAWIPGGAIPELIFQSLLIATGVFPAWKLGQTLNQDPRWFALVYAIHPAVIGGSWFGFRPWNLALPIFMWVTWWIIDRPTTSRFIASGLLMLVFREDLAIWVGLLILIVALAKKTNLRSVLTSGTVLAAATAIVVFIILPSRSFVDEYYFASSTEIQVVNAGLASLFSSFLVRVTFLFLPPAVMPRRINWLLVLPLSIPIAGLLIRGGNSLTTFFHYDMMFVPLLLVILGLSTEVEFRPKLLVVLSLITLALFGPLRPFGLQGGGNPLRFDSTIAQDLDAIKADIRTNPDHSTASMSVPPRLVAHFSERSNIFIHPFPIDVWSEKGIEPPYSIRFDCPEPTLVVAHLTSLDSTWESVLDESYSATNLEGNSFEVWTRDSPLANQPCTATRASGS